MIHPNLIRYAYDDTGINLDNLVKDEKHKLVDKRFRAVVPMYGAFYADSLIIKESSVGESLIRGKDYVVIELHQSLTLKLGKEIAGAALVINPKISPNIIITYQCVGGEYGVNSDTAQSLLAKSSDVEVSKSYWDIENKPQTVTPSPHLHDLGDLQGLEVVVYHLERLRNALIWADSHAVESALRFVQDSLDSILARLILKVENEYLALIIDYKNRFNKTFIGLSKLKDLPIASEEEGRQVFGGDFELEHPHFDKYVTTEALTAFKEVLYSALVSSGLTHIGRAYGPLVTPRLVALRDIPQGSTFVLDSLDNSKALITQYDPAVYPSDDYPFARWSITKISQKPGESGSVFMAVNMQKGDIYTGHMRVSSADNVSIEWRKHMSENDVEGFLDKLIDHLNDHNNPHKTRKKQIALGNVENLPVASKEDIVCRKPVRKYITYDGLLLYAKAFLTGIKGEEDIQIDNEDVNVLEMYQTIFAPCGPCGGLKERVPMISCDPKGTELLTYCDEGFVKKKRFADGNCGFYDEIIEENSPSCGWQEEVPLPTPEPEKRFALGWEFTRSVPEGAEPGNYDEYGEESIAKVVKNLNDEDMRPNDDALRFYCDGDPNEEQNNYYTGEVDKNYANWNNSGMEGKPFYTEKFGVDDGFWKEGYTIKILPPKENELDLLKYMEEFDLQYDPNTGQGQIRFTYLDYDVFINKLIEDFEENKNNEIMIGVLNNSFAQGSDSLSYAKRIKELMNSAEGGEDNFDEFEQMAERLPSTPRAHIRIGVYNEQNTLRGWLLFFTSFHRVRPGNEGA